MTKFVINKTVKYQTFNIYDMNNCYLVDLVEKAAHHPRTVRFFVRVQLFGFGFELLYVLVPLTPILV